MSDMKEYEVKTGVEIPKKRSGGRPLGHTKYPWAQMNVGDCFDVPVEDVEAKGRLMASNMRSVAGNHARRCGGGLKYAVRLMKQEGVVRVWRVG